MKFFKRKKPEKSFWLLPKAEPLPTCPVHGNRCGQAQIMPGVWVADFRPCEALQGVIRRAELAQSHEAVFNPITNDFDIFPRY
jgi:hypothetical protein